MIRVTIIGAGLSGTLCAMRLLMIMGRQVRITMVERRARRMHRGVAYSARLSQQLLNVPAGNMSLFPEKPDDLLEWARSGPLRDVRAEAYIPRMLFGDYLNDRFHALAARHSGRVEVVQASATGLERDPVHGYRVTLDNGRKHTADVVLLAMGNAPPAHVPGLTTEATAHRGYVAWPWRVGALDNIGPQDSVLFTGAGLTMTDLLLSMDDRGHRGPIIVLSRHGRLPLPHVPRAPYELQQPLPQVPFTVLGLLHWLRREVRLAAAREVPWQQVMDRVKEFVQGWWQGMDTTERARFMRHARPFWEIHRHRMPTEVHARLQGLVANGRVSIMAGRIQRIAPDGDELQVTIAGKHTREISTLSARHVINCTGPQADTRRLDQPLLAGMLESGLAAWDPLHLGLHTGDLGALVDPNGLPIKGLYAIGPLCKANLWEITAVPEIRAQAAALAAHLAERSKELRVPGWRYWMMRLSDRSSAGR